MDNSGSKEKTLAELYREEVHTHGGALARDVLALEALCLAGAASAQIQPLLASLLRAAHSLKGAARIMRFTPVVQVAHELEELLLAAERTPACPSQQVVDALLLVSDFLNASGTWSKEQAGSAAVAKQARNCVVTLQRLSFGDVAESLATEREDRPFTSRENAEPAAHPASGSAVSPSVGKASDPASTADPSATNTPPTPSVAKDAPAASTHFSTQSTAPARPAGNVDGGTSGNASSVAAEGAPGDEPMLRIRADLVNDLLQLGAQGRVLSHRMDQLPQRFLRLSEQQLVAEQALETCSAQLAAQGLDAALRRQLLAPLRAEMVRLRALGSELYEHTSQYVQEQALLSERWYAQVLACRTRPFADIVSGFPRLVRDAGRQLGKQMVLRLEGTATLADRDIMENLEMPLVHLLRNACSHGIEPPAERVGHGKPGQGIITLSATHSDGWLQVSVRDDGRGVDLERLRRRVEQGSGQGAQLSDQELLEQVFIQGFSTSERADVISGRGIGLAAVRSRVRELGGQIHVENQPGQGVTFTLRVPVTRALLRVLCVRLLGEPYALPLGQIQSLLRVSPQEAQAGQVTFAGRQVPIFQLGDLLEAQGADASQENAVSENAVSEKSDNLLEESGAVSQECGSVPKELDSGVSPTEGAVAGEAAGSPKEAVPSEGAVPQEAAGRRMVVLRAHGRNYVLDAGAVEDELELIVHELDDRLGDLPLLQSAGLNEVGEVVLVLDAEALCSRMVALATNHPPRPAVSAAALRPLRILLAEDSALARARIGSILEAAGGFELTSVADGRLAWQQLQTQPKGFDLLLSDFEMPGMDGCELAQKVRTAPPPLAALPIAIISAKDGIGEWLCGESVGANLYLSKTLLGSDPEAFVRALRKLRQLDPSWSCAKRTPRL